jgi:anti-sigma factor RsiW
MNNGTNSPVCERSSDLMAFLYNEMSATESRQFQSHLQTCSNCREEAAAFGLVRESIVSWRDEVLTGFVPSTSTPARKSALAAFRQFFDLSPLWLKGATAFSVLTFCVLVVLAFVNFKKQDTVATKNDAGYTQEEVDRFVKEALAQQQPPVETVPKTSITLRPSRPPKPVKQRFANRRPLSRAEREQLAADLRLLPTDDDLNLPGDRINQ